MNGNEPTDITHLLDQSGTPPKRFEPDATGWVPHGHCVAYRADGSLLLEITYESGVAHGSYRDYWSNGRVSLEGQHLHGLQEGEWRFYDRDTGKLREGLRFVAGREVVDWEELFRPGRAER
jgi:antitoxin component YwqK of YwqJK toxin-antitoxin module